MKRSVPKVTLSLLSVVALLFLVLPAVPALAQVHAKPFVIQPTHHDLSQPLRDMVLHEVGAPITGQHVVPLHATPPLPGAPATEDRALQKDVLPLVGTVPGLNFAGVNSLDDVAPPDTNGSVGATQYVQTVNFHFAVYDKSNGNLLLGPALINTVWSGFGGDCDVNGNGGDPDVVYDKAANQWIISQLSGTYNSWCMAISTTSDATGTYFRYAFPSNGVLNDYPKLGVWPDAYYWTSNTFGGQFNGVALTCAFDRPSMLTGGAANGVCFQTGTNGIPAVSSMMPADLDGSTPPPSGEPNPLVYLNDTSHLGVFLFHVDFNNPANSTLSGPTLIAVDSYSQGCGGFGDCVPQQGTGTLLEDLGDRVLYRGSYRNFGDHEALLIHHDVSVSGNQTGIRWYEIHDPTGTPTIAQSGTWAPDTSYRWFGSMAMDQLGNIALGYSVSSGSMDPSIRYTGRIPSDPPGQMESENSILEGTHFQSGLNRWGDYSDMSIDPSDDCTFFYTNEYLASNGSFSNWATQIASFKFPNCGSSTPDFFMTASPASQSVAPGGTATYTATATPFNGFTGTVNLTVSGCPANATCTLNPTSVNVPPAGNSTLTVQTTSSIAPGNYIITVTGTSGALVHSTTVNLVVQDFSISATPASITIKKGGTAFYKATVTAVNGFNGVVTFSVTGVPVGATATFSPKTVTGHGNSNLTITTTKKTPIGSFKLGVTGTSGSISHAANVTLNVVHHVK